MRVTKDEEQSLYFFTSLNLWYLSVLIYTKIHPFGTGPLYIKLVKDMISLNHRTSSLKDWKKIKCRLVIPHTPPPPSTLFNFKMFSLSHLLSWGFFIQSPNCLFASVIHSGRSKSHAMLDTSDIMYLKCIKEQNHVMSNNSVLMYWIETTYS